MSIIRRFTPLEHSYFAFDTVDQSPMCNQYVIEGVGHFSHLHWKSAIDQAVEANPGIASVLKGRWAWRGWHDNGTVPSLTAAPYNWDANSSCGAEFDRKKLDCKKGQVAEVVLIEGDFPKIIFRTHHALMDGNATLFWIKEVFRALRDEDLSGSRSDANEIDILERYDREEVEDFSGTCTPVFEPSFNEGIERQCSWLSVKFDKKPDGVLSKAIEFISRSISMEAQRRVVFRVPTDMRRLLPEDSEYLLSNCVAALDFEVAYEDDSKTINKKILSGLFKNQDLRVFPKQYKLGRFLPDSAFRPPEKHYRELYQQKACDITAIVTHVGKVSLSEFSCQDFKATNIFAIPVPLCGVSLSCVFIEHDQGLSLCMGSPLAYASVDRLEKFAKEMSDFFKQES